MRYGSFDPKTQDGKGRILDFDFCPRFYWALDDQIDVDGEPVYTGLSRALKYRKDGILPSLIPPPWTPALIEGLDFLEALEQERGLKLEKAKVEAMRRAAKKAASRAG